MPTVDTVVIGAGHAGLAVSRLLVHEGVDHVVLDRGRVGESWRSARWDSLHLLTPSWMTRLPGWVYAGPDSDGFMSAARFVRHLEGYAASFGAPLRSGTSVVEVNASGDGYVVVTDRGTWRARHVVLATGPGSHPRVPAAVGDLDPGVHVLHSADYRNPAALPDGGVLVVGASASGVQIADELSATGREVLLAAGRHTRVPRRYRGVDIYWWLERTGRLARTIEDVRDRRAARREPSMQLVGRPDPEHRNRDLDLATLRARGVRLAGHLVGAHGRRVHFADDLADSVADADARLHRLLDGIDRHIDESRLGGEVWPPHRPAPVRLGEPLTELDLGTQRIGTVLLATGYRQHLPWLRLPITAPDGSIRQVRGRTAAPGVYVVGQRFQHRRDSAMIDGVRHDAVRLVGDLVGAAGRGGPAGPGARGPGRSGGSAHDQASRWAS